MYSLLNCCVLNYFFLPATWAPGLTHWPKSTGSVLLVTVTMASAPLTASSAETHTVTGPLTDWLNLSAPCLVPLHTRTCGEGKVWLDIKCILSKHKTNFNNNRESEGLGQNREDYNTVSGVTWFKWVRLINYLSVIGVVWHFGYIYLLPCQELDENPEATASNRFCLAWWLETRELN